MISRSLCLFAGAVMLLVLGIGCEEEVKKEATPPKVEKAKPIPLESKATAKPPAPAPTPKVEEKKLAPPSIKKPEAKEPPAPATPPAKKSELTEPAPAPAKKAETKGPAKKTEVTVSKVTAPAPAKAEPAPAPAQKEPETAKAEPEKKVTPPRPRTPPAVGPFNAEDKAWVADDFEQGNNFWVAESWANPAKLSISDGELKVELEAGESDKTAISRPAALDISDRSKVMLSVRNGTGKDVKVALAFATGGSSTYFETEPFAVKPGLNEKVTFDLKSDKFKSEATDWKHATKLSDADTVKRLVILIYGEGQGEVCLDNIRLEK